MSEPAVAPFTVNPLSAAEDALWDVLTTSPYLSQLRPTRYVRKAEDWVEGVRHEDSPQYRIRPVPGGQPTLKMSTSSARLPQHYAIEIYTADANPSADYYPAKFGVFRTLVAAQKNKRDLGLPFVSGFSVIDATDEDTNVTGEAGAWSGAFVVAVDMILPLSDLIATA